MSAIDLQDRVLRELRFDQRIDSSKIGVAATDDGIVTLSGAVPSYSDRRGAEAAAKRVKSVKAVANDIDVRLPGDMKNTDTDIAQRAIDSLRWRSSIPAERITFTVSSGWVTMEGDVDFHFQRQETEHVVSGLNGVVGVSNKIRVVPLTDPKSEAVKQEIGRPWRGMLVSMRRTSMSGRKGRVSSCKDGSRAGPSWRRRKTPRGQRLV